MEYSSNLPISNPSDEMPSKLVLHARQNLRKRLLKAVKQLPPTKPLSTPDWAQANLRLPEENADVPGEYDLDYAPYLYGIFAALDDPLIPEVVCMKAAQVGWTAALIAFLGKNVDNTPCPIIIMFAAEGAAREFNDEKFKPIVEVTPNLSKHIDVGATRKDGQRALFRKFTGGFIKLISSNAVRSVKSTPARIVVVEEPDDAQDNVGNQGDAIRLLWERAKRMRRSKRVLGGTPAIKGFSAVESHLASTDKRVLPVYCFGTDDNPGCGVSHVLDFANVSWVEGDETMVPDEVFGRALIETAAYVCPECGSVWDNYQRKSNIRRTVAEAIEAGDPLCGWVPTQKSSTGAVGFHELNELYSCLPGAGLQELVQDYLTAEWKGERGDQNDRIVFQNSKLGRPYEYQSDGSTAAALRERYKDAPFSEWKSPAGGLVVSAGVDVQHDRLALTVWAWGRGHQGWLLYWGEIAAAETCVDKNDEVWDSLDTLLSKKIPSEHGGRLRIEGVTIDCSDGGTSDAVYEYVRSRSKQQVFKGVKMMAGKGSSAQADPEIFVLPTQKSVDHKRADKRTKADRKGVKVHIIGTNKAKDWIVEHFKLKGDGDGRLHVYPEVRADFYDQITSEVKVPHKTIRNRKVYQKKEGVRNEALDCFVYALHAARALRVHLMKPNEWDVWQAAAERLTETEKKKRRTRQRRGQGGAGSGWVKTGDNWIGGGD